MDDIDITSMLQDDYIEINLESLKEDSLIDFNVFILRNEKYILYRESSLPFTKKEKDRLIDNRIKHIFINAIDKKKYYRYVESNLTEIVSDPEIPDEKKSMIIYDTSKELIKDVICHPRAGENIKRSKMVVDGTLDFVLGHKHSMHHLMNVMSFDYYTYTHSVNVSLFSVALAEKLDIGDRENMFRFGLGALLHDIGKGKIPDSIINKKGKLTPDEWALMKKHPEFGVEILKARGDEITEDSLYPVIQHHEKYNGKGYPYGLKGDEIHIYGKIVNVADIFDALTTKRSYKDAIQSFDAFKLMREFEGEYDPCIFKEFVILMAKETK